MCDHVAVMYAGRIVEKAAVRVISIVRPSHTKALMSSAQGGERVERLFSIEGQPPVLLNLPPGCSFLPRCAETFDKCPSEAYPPVVELPGNHFVRCWHYV